MREAAELAEPSSVLLELDAGESIGIGAVGADAETVEKGLADQVRRVAQHRADADIDARLAKIDRLELRMRVGHVQDARIAEAVEIVGAVGAASAPRQAACERRSARERQEIPAADGHASLRASMIRKSAQRFSEKIMLQQKN